MSAGTPQAQDDLGKGPCFLGPTQVSSLLGSPVAGPFFPDIPSPAPLGELSPNHRRTRGLEDALSH